MELGDDETMSVHFFPHGCSCRKWGSLTSRAVQVGDTKDIGGTTDGAAFGTGAESGLTVHQRAPARDGGGQRRGCAGEGDDDGGETHSDVRGWIVVGEFFER